MDFTKWLDAPDEDLHHRLANIAQELAGCYRELAQVRITEKRARVEAMLTSPERSASGRSQQADSFSIDATSARVEVEADIAILKEEKELIERLLDAR